MKINKLKIFKEKGKMKLCVIPLAGLMAVSGLTACSYEENNTTSYTQEENAQTKEFDIGEHILSVPIDDPRKEVKQYEYHPGYKPIGITADSYGPYGASYGGACILYINETEVECRSIKIKDGEYVYDTFGFPTDYEKPQASETLITKEFDTGEHIISVPINDPTKTQVQYEFYDGYEPVGITSSKYGKYSGCYGGGCILYINTEPVTCQKNEENTYTSFGIPTEKALTKVKK